jgi:uncharacterized membrane protein YfcA
MPSDELIKILVLGFSAALIGVSKAGFGGGTGILVAPLMALVMEPRAAIGLMLPLLSATDFASLKYYWRQWDTKNVRELLPGALVGILVGAWVLQRLDNECLRKVIGVLALLFAGLQFVRERWLRPEEGLVLHPAWGVAAGVVTGVTSTLAHVGGVVTSLFLLVQKLPNRTFVGTTTILYLIINLTKVPIYVGQGLLTVEVLRHAALLLPLVLLGTATGIFLNQRVSPQLFSRVILVLVVVTGVKLLSGK